MIMPRDVPIESRHVIHKCGAPRGHMVNRPSVEYTGNGNDLICFAWNGRYFRSSIDFVKAKCDEVCELANGKDGEDGEYVNINTLHDRWGIAMDDSGERFGWSPSENYAYPCFTFDLCGKGTKLYDMFGEDVWLVSIPRDATPYEDYWEV